MNEKIDLLTYLCNAISAQIPAIVNTVIWIKFKITIHANPFIFTHFVLGSKSQLLSIKTANILVPIKKA